ncbi:MAG: aldose epimerase family protein [Ruegeria sp.]
MSRALKRPKDITTAVLVDGDMTVSVLSYGAITQGWWLKDTPLILGYRNPEAYRDDNNYVGAIVGRVANRIGGARFDLDDEHFRLDANEGQNTLHGGSVGLSHQDWDLDLISPNDALLSCVSEDGAGGFPGKVRFEVTISLQAPQLIYSISAWPDRPTPISIAQHNYYTLGVPRNVSKLTLVLASDRFLETDEQGVPTGLISDATRAGLDFSLPREIGQASQDLDHYFVFRSGADPKSPVARLVAPSGLTMNVYSDQPGAQVYSGAHFSKPLGQSGGVCIEPSGYPNATNVGTFPSMIFSPDNPYRQVLALEISEGPT